MEKAFESEKELRLIERLHEIKKVAIAYSGGVDSTYLLALAQQELKENAVGILVRGAMISKAEEREALELAQQLNFNLKVIDLNVFAISEFVTNPPDRCYFCKKHVFTAISNWANNRGYVVLDGTNYSDEGDYRPGRKALAEMNILSPLLEMQLTKEEIRILSRKLDLPTWNKPSMACLASRVPYGNPITPEVLTKVEKAEEILHRKGIIECRVRIHSDLARIEVPKDQLEYLVSIKDEICQSFQELGYRFVTLDLMGLRSGSLNPVD